LANIQESLLTGRLVSALYLGPTDRKPLEIQLHPLGIVQRAKTPYLVATAFDYSDVRLYAVQRFQRATVMDERAVSPKGFTLDRYLADGAMEFSSGNKLRLQIWVSTQMAIQLAETPLSTKQAIKPVRDGHVVRADVADSWQLRWWLLSQGPSVRVLAPVGLRREMRETLSEALGGYD
jgi:predicted DNA-binding transcriptional regulator YafY